MFTRLNTITNMADNQIPNEITIGVYYYFDEEGKPHFDVEEMQREFEQMLINLEKLSEKY